MQSSTRPLIGCAALLSLLVAGSGCAVHLSNYPRLIAVNSSTQFLIRDVRVFPATGPKTIEHQDVFVDDGVIQEIVPTDPNRVFHGTVLEGAGKTLMPGLVDLHAHTTMTSAPPWYEELPDPQHNLEAHLFAGATTVLDLGGGLRALTKSREKIATGEWAGPRLYFAGPIITKTGGYPMSMLKKVYGWLAASVSGDDITTQVNNADEAQAAVRDRWAHGASVIKVVVADIPRGAPRLSEDELRAIVDQATALDLKVCAHIDTTADAMLAIKVGIKLLAHGVETAALTQAEARALAASGVTVEPTLVNYERFDRVAQMKYEPDSVEKASESPEMLASFGPEHVKNAKLDPGFYAWGDELEAHEADRAANARLLFDAGVPIVVGTDAMGSVATFAGAIHDELKFLVAAGIPTADVLLSATARAARFLDPQAMFGTIEKGKAADLLMVRGNPLDDIEATREIDTVVARGRILIRTGH